MTYGSLFSGIGGIDLGLDRAGMRCIFQCETDPYACKVLEKHWPGVKRYGDITQVNWEEAERPDLLCGGFPCQDISQAGKRAGITGNKSKLWKEYLRAICLLRPNHIIVENVSALLVRGLDVVLSDLARGGYDAEWGVLSSAGVGKDHQRRRVFVYAYPHSGDTAEERVEVGRGGRLTCTFHAVEAYVVSRDQTAQEPGIHRVATGIPSQLDRLKCLGNAVDVQVAERLGKAIMEYESNHNPQQISQTTQENATC